MEFGDKTDLEHLVDLLSRAQQLLPLDFSGGPVLKNSPANAGDTGLILVQEDSICQGVLGVATKLMGHNYQSPHAPEPVLCDRRSYCS